MCKHEHDQIITKNMKKILNLIDELRQNTKSCSFSPMKDHSNIFNPYLVSWEIKFSCFLF